MTRAVYVLRDGQLVPKATAAPLPTRMANVMPDIAEFRTINGDVIGSRSSLREYEQRTGTRQIGNDFNSLAQQLREKRT
jgi:hypothetical protein